MNVENEHVCEEVNESRKVKINDQLINYPTFDENKPISKENEHASDKEVKYDEMPIDEQSDVIEMENYPSLTSNVDFIGIEATLTQEENLANIGYDNQERCFMIVGLETQYVENDGAQLLIQRRLLDKIDKFGLKSFVHPL